MEPINLRPNGSTDMSKSSAATYHIGPDRVHRVYLVCPLRWPPQGCTGGSTLGSVSVREASLQAECAQSDDWYKREHCGEIYGGPTMHRQWRMTQSVPTGR